MTTGAEPEVIYVPPHETVYHFQAAPSEPNDPPVIPSVEEPPVHIVEGEAEADTGAVDNEFTVTVVLAHEVVLQEPSALTK